MARESFLSSSVCVLARRVSTRVHAARELSHTCRIPILGKLSSRTLLRYVHQTRRRATLNLANVMLPLVLRYIRYYEGIVITKSIAFGIGKCYFITRYKSRDIYHHHIKIVCIIYASLCEISSNLSCFLIFIKTYIVRIFRFWLDLSHVVRGNRKSFTGYDELFLPWRRKIAGNFPLARRIAPCICVCMYVYTRGVWCTRVSM